jgi:hypothetical protein
LNVIAESDGLSYPTQAYWEGDLTNVDEEKKSSTNPAIAENLIEGDQKVLRRDGLVTAHITMEDSAIETDLRPYSGVDITVETTLNS